VRPTSRWGITLPLSGMPLTGQRDLVAALPDLGYTDAWSSEVNGHDAFTPLVLAAQWTSGQGTGTPGAGPPGAGRDEGGLRLGTAVANIYTRGPALLAMSAATLAAIAPGRFVLGIGVSSPAVVTDWNGIALERPYQRARDMLRFLRRALAGEKVSMEGDTFSVNGFRLDPAPVPPLPQVRGVAPRARRIAFGDGDLVPVAGEQDSRGQPVEPPAHHDNVCHGPIIRRG